jgi:hypothetical protein
MASTYSTNLKIELMATGENSGTWGGITNTNLGTALEQAIVGYGNPEYLSDATLTISLADSNAAQIARALVLNVTSVLSLTTTRELVVPTIQKQYIVQNNTTGGQSITVKTSGGTGITVPNGRKAHLYVDGTNVIQMFDFVDINGGAIDGTTVGASSASTGAFTTLTASGATTLNGAVALGDAAADLITVPGTVNSNVIFTDNTFDIGASGATRPRTGYFATSVVTPLATVTTVNATTIDTTNLEVTNIKAKDGTSAIVLTDSTGAVTISTALTANGGAVFNENGADVDFRVEGDTDTHLILADASADRVGIGTSTPSYKLEVQSSTATEVTILALTSSADFGYDTNLDFRKPLTTGGAIGTAGRIRSGYDSSNNYNLQFLTTGTGTLAERARITSTGTLNIVGAGTAGSTQAISFNGSTPVDTLVTTSTGVGIGTSSPAQKLQISANEPKLRITSTAGSGKSWDISSGGGTTVNVGEFCIYDPTTDTQRFNIVSGSGNMTFNASGNLGLGVTPSDWNANNKVLQLTNNASLFSRSGFTGVAQNFRYNASDTGIFMSAGYATLYYQNAGSHIWTVSTTSWNGTGSDTASLSQAMTLDASGNLLVGTTSLTTGISGDETTLVLKGNSSGNAAAYVSVNGAGTGTGFFGTATNDNTYVFAKTNHALLFGTNNTERARIDSSGHQLIGYTSSVGTAYQPNIQVKGSSTSNYGAYGVVSSNNEMLGFMGVWSHGENSLVIVADPDNLRTSSSIVFSTDGVANERARITSGGYFKASNTGSYVGSTGTYHEMVSNDTNNTLVVRNSSTSSVTDGTIFISNARNTTDNTYYIISAYNTTANLFRFRVADSGDVTNTNNSYGAISDQKMKTDIVDAGSQWSDIKALRFRKFKMKDDPSGRVQLGVVAQEVELTSPGLVDEHQDRDAEGTDLGTTTKSVKTSVLLMKAAVALQEAMARIETLEAEVAALKGA